jgi:hypothetical protein
MLIDFRMVERKDGVPEDQESNVETDVVGDIGDAGVPKLKSDGNTIASGFGLL